MEPFVLIIFGITGNLAQLKLIPALYDLEERGMLPKDCSVVGIGRRHLAKEDFKKYLTESLTSENSRHHKETQPKILQALLSKMEYLEGDFESAQKPDSLYRNLKDLLKSRGPSCSNTLYYLATYPNLYATIFQSLKDHGLNSQERGWVRLMIEKPLGHNLASAKDLDVILHRYFTEEQIYRLDHYLGKETLQNILVFRFGNNLWRSVMNHEHVDHIQITATEDFGIGKRGGYYDSMGALLDIGQNHLLQMLVVATMEQPTELSNEAITRERIKIIKNLKPNPEKIILGQYNGYLYEEKITPNSKTNTFFALKTEIQNDRWQGVPIYMRAGKKLSQTVAEISIVFKTDDNQLFHHELGNRPNVLTYRLQPNEGIGIEILTKRPGHKFILDSDYLQYCYRDNKNEPPDVYEKLIHDALIGDQTFFNDSKEVEASWNFIDKLSSKSKDPVIYEPGSWGPKEANDLIEADGRKWLEPSPILCALPGFPEVE